MSTIAAVAEKLGHQAFDTTVRNDAQPWVPKAYLNSVQEKLQGKFPADSNWARRIRDAVEKSSGFTAAVALANMGQS